MVRLVDPLKGRVAPSHARDAGRRHDIWEWRQGRGGELPNAVGPNGVLQGPDETDRSPGTQHPIPSCAESYLIRDALGYPDLALKGKITFGVSAAQKNKIDVDRTHAA